MQEKAWSTGGLKNFINKNAYGQYISTTPHIEKSSTGAYHYTKHFDKIILINELFLVNHNKKLVIYMEIKNDLNNMISIYSLDYDNFMDNIISINSEASNLIDAYNINSVINNKSSIGVECLPESVPYNEGDNVEFIYKTTKYAPRLEL